MGILRYKLIKPCHSIATQNRLDWRHVTSADSASVPLPAVAVS